MAQPREQRAGLRGFQARVIAPRLIAQPGDAVGQPGDEAGKTVEERGEGHETRTYIEHLPGRGNRFVRAVRAMARIGRRGRGDLAPAAGRDGRGCRVRLRVGVTEPVASPPRLAQPASQCLAYQRGARCGVRRDPRLRGAEPGAERARMAAVPGPRNRPDPVPVLLLRQLAVDPAKEAAPVWTEGRGRGGPGAHHSAGARVVPGGVRAAVPCAARHPVS